MSDSTDKLLSRLVEMQRDQMENHDRDRREDRETLHKMQESVGSLALSVKVLTVNNDNAEARIKEIDAKHDEKYAYIKSKVTTIETKVTDLDKYQYSSYRMRSMINNNWFKVVGLITILTPVIGSLYWVYSSTPKGG